MVRVNGVHVTRTTGCFGSGPWTTPWRRCRANEKPVPNDFFAGTIFNALFPKGSTYESLMPPLPLKRVPRSGCGRRSDPKAVAAGEPGCHRLMLTLLGLAACTDPARTSASSRSTWQGPVQLDHRAVIDQKTGVVISSQVDATARPHRERPQDPRS